MTRTVPFLAIVVSALALVPSAAHLAAMPNKIAMPQAAYFTAQSIYAGWALLGLLWPAAMILNGAAAFRARDQPEPFLLALLAALCFALALAVFMMWTQPANSATHNWTTVPADWETLRREWEYSHAANAVLLFAALCLSTLSALSRPRGG